MKIKYIYGLILFGILTSCQFDYLNYCQHIEIPESKYCYALYTDNFGIGDVEFVILRIEKPCNPKELNFKWSFSKRDTVAERWIKDRTILSNYEEGSSFIDNENIEIISNKYLVFSRGGLYFALYDLVADSAVVNDYSPWHGWAETYSRGPDYRTNRELEKQSYKVWIERNLQEPIVKYIKKDK